MKHIKLGTLFLLAMLILCSVGWVSAQDAEDVEATDYLFFSPAKALNGLVVKPDGNLLTSDGQSISEYNLFGELVEVYEADASGTSFDDIVDLAITPSGDVYVVTGFSPVINLYDSNWELKQTIETEIETLGYYDVAYDPVNKLLYLGLGVPTGPMMNTIRILGYNTEGEVSEIPLSLAGDFYLYGSMAVDSAGNVIYGYSGKPGELRVLQTDGTLLRNWELSFEEEMTQQPEGMVNTRYYPTPFGITIDSVGRIYAYEVYRKAPVAVGSGMRTSGIATITAPNGTLLRQFSVALEDSPIWSKMALSPDESLLYVSTANFIHVISLTKEPPFTTVQLTQNGRLRAAPVDGAVVDSFPAGTILIVTGQNDAGDWLQVHHEGAEAWVAAFLTEPLNR